MKSILAAVVLGLASTAVAASQDGAHWLMKINNAARELNYTGTYVYVEGHRIESMRVTHRANEGAMRQRIYSLNGAPREVIRDSEQVWCYIPDKKVGVHEYRQASKQGFPNLLPEGLDHLVQYYKVEIGSEGRIADRRAQQIRVEPRDDFRYGYDLWADKQTGLLLSAALLNEKNQPIEQYLFTQVVIGGSIPADALEPVTPKSALVWYGDAQKSKLSGGDAGEMVSGNWVVDEVPEGFVLTRKIKRLSPLRTKMLEHYVYSDGLASVSVFVESLEAESGLKIKGLNKMGAIHAFGREIDGYQITVVGEVPSRTVDLIGKSVRPKQ